MLCFDIETCPLSEEVVLAAAGEFIPPPHPGEFDPGSVKLGNLKDQAKIEAKIAEARAAHEAGNRGSNGYSTLGGCRQFANHTRQVD